MQLRRCGMARQQSGVQRHRGSHTLVVIVHNGAKYRRTQQGTHFLHLRKVFVLQIQSIQLRCIQCRPFVRHLVLCDHLFSSAAVASQRKAGQRVIRRQQTVFHQRIHSGNKARGMAAGIGHALPRGNGGSVLRRQLGKAVGPALCCAVSRRGVNDPGSFVLHQGHSLPGRRVWQAQKHNIRRVDALFPLSGVFAFVLVDQ